VKTTEVISDTVLACLKAQGLALVRDGSPVDPADFARDVAANATMALTADDDGLVKRTANAYQAHDWRPSDKHTEPRKAGGL
jgi:hypothetical protein